MTNMQIGSLNISVEKALGVIIFLGAIIAAGVTWKVNTDDTISTIKSTLGVISSRQDSQEQHMDNEDKLIQQENNILERLEDYAKQTNKAVTAQ